ncbi:hypothetical protein J6590_096700, partial [Homalodisca vitripennis]
LLSEHKFLQHQTRECCQIPTAESPYIILLVRALCVINTWRLFFELLHVFESEYKLQVLINVAF